MRASILATVTSAAFFLVGIESSISAEPIPEKPTDFLVGYCLDCHDADTEKGEVNLDFLEIAWQKEEARDHWERVLKAVESGQMPPKKKKTQPSDEERAAMVAWLDATLSKHSATGGTVVRRLNRDEYLNTVRKLFGSWVQLPDGFPRDNAEHGFDTVGETLILSPPLMEAYTEAAAAIADEIFPPTRPDPVSEIRTVTPDELVISYSSGTIIDGAMRLASKCGPISRSSTWPTKVELKHSGVYRIRVDASAFKPATDEPMQLKVLARDVSSTDNVRADTLRELLSIEIIKETAETFEFEAELYEGQTIVCYWANAPLDSDRDDKDQLVAVFRDKFAANPRYLAAWQRLSADDDRGGFRGGIGWERVKKFMADDDLDLSAATLDSKESETLLKKIRGNTVLFTETVAYDHFENGPALAIHGVQIEGPLKVIDGPRDVRRKEIRGQLLGEQGDLSEAGWVHRILASFLEQAFRRPVDEPLTAVFEQLVAEHRAAGHSLEQGIHLAIRTALISPRFLYREMTPGRLDDYDLAGRLAYFLTSSPPDDKLLALAESGRLSDPKVLNAQAQRLLPKNHSAPLIGNFTGQWLDTRMLADIMPDPRLKFSDNDVRSAEEEVERFFAEMLITNLPMTDFIDPDFTWTSASIARKIYGLEKGYNAKNRSLQRVTLERGGRYGGVLGQAGVLMATANGVDTQPVIRGVWVLENILGDPPPPPPKAVPAITPDTTGAKTPRDLLAAHTTSENCAGCHKKIDPVGFALENYDPVGRWREVYPIHTRDDMGRPISKPGVVIDPSGQLPDGTPIADAIALKRWIVANIDDFSECLAEQLLTYATGREPNYLERKEIAAIVASNNENDGGNGFRDLLLALIDSETFRTK